MNGVFAGPSTILSTDSRLEADFVPPSRARGFKSQYGKLAIAVLADAIDLVRRGPDSPVLAPNCPCPGDHCRCYYDAYDWLQDLHETGPFSLRGCCEWMTLLTGEFVDPVAIASRVRSGEDLGIPTRRVAGRQTSVSGKRARAPRRKRA